MITEAPPTTVQFLGSRARLLDAGLVEMSDIPAGHMPPLHVHHAEDEGFYVLEGEATLFMPGRQVTLGPGDFFLAPRGVPHTYRVGDAPAKWLVTHTDGFADFVLAVSELPEPDPETLSGVAAERQIEILGPPGALP
jgi:quercetin dioxygenase-like cupin family protein